MPDNTNKPVTLGDKLIVQGGGLSLESLNILLLFIIIAVPAILLFTGSGIDLKTLILVEAGLILFSYILVAIKRRLTVKSPKGRFLITGDRQGFMKNLKLADKTVIFDGSNVYHFGLDNGVGTQALTALVKRLRSDGFRIVSFFDANIYFTLRDNGAFQSPQQVFKIEALQRVFGLRVDEIYVVPRGNQADKFVLESLAQLPVSFAVTNDRFRDYQAEYDFLTKDNQWRKGVEMSDGQLFLYQYKFAQPIVL